MEKLNMANMNTLIRKGYLLAGVILAANMFIVNEMKAMKDNENNFEENGDEKGNEEINGGEGKEGEISGVQGFFNFVLTYENTINFIGGLALSGANNYFKWWDYNPGGYLNLRIGCLGWRSKRLLDIFQFEVNLNGIRGALWLIPGAYNFIKGINSEGKKTKDVYLKALYVSYLVANCFKSDNSLTTTAFIGSFLLQGFVSMPLILHFSNFSISISLDSMIWAVIGHILELKDKKDLEEIKKFNEGEELYENLPITQEETTY